jgi:outer membrane protein, heavy metal efflux system
MRARPIALVAAALALVTGCASTSPEAAFKDVAQSVETRSGHKVRWDQGGDDDKEADKAIDRLLSRDLTVDGAVQVALLANPSLRGKFEELAISQADLVQAGLLKNPAFGIGRTAWDMEHIDPNLFATVEQDFLDLLTMPMRKRVAKTELEATKLEVGDHVLELAA